MNLAPLSEAEWEDPASVQEVVDLNDLTHNEIYVRMLDAGLVLNHLPMGTDFEDKETLSDWAYIHDAEHRQIASLLGIQAPPDLSEFDFQDQAQFDAWLAYHLAHHVLISQALG